MKRPSDMNVAILCEHSGVLRDAFRRLGFNAYSNDLEEMKPEGDFPEFHIVGDCLQVMKSISWDLIIAHPPCTFVCGSGWHWNKNDPARAAKSVEAIEFARQLIDTPYAKHVAVENPVGVLSRFIRKPNDIVQPYEFGDNASKKTCLWLKGLPKLVRNPDQFVVGRCVEWPAGSDKFVPRWANQTDSGQNRLPPSADRWKLRSQTYPGLANAIAAQWGAYILEQA